MGRAATSLLIALVLTGVFVGSSFATTMVADVGGETVLVRGSGPFEVSGEPESWAVAWIDGNAERGFVLSIASFEDGPKPSVIRLSGEVDPAAGILLHKGREATVVCWRERDGWRLGLLRRDRGADGASPLAGPYRAAVHRLGTAGRPLALSTNDGRVALLLAPPERDVATEIRTISGGFGTGINFPVLESPALFEIEPGEGKPRLLMEFASPIRRASLAYHGRRWSVAAVEAEPAALWFAELDEDGPVRNLRRLNNFPVAASRPTLRLSAERALVGWIELSDGAGVAMTGLLDRAGPVVTLSTAELSSPVEDTAKFLLSEGPGAWTFLSAEIDGRPRFRICAIGAGGESSCHAATEEDPGASHLWLLASEEEALVFRERDLAEGGPSLTVQRAVCPTAPSSGTDNETAAITAETSAPREDEGSSNRILGGGEDPCDGIDNDSDGIVDEGCDLTCDGPARAGDPVAVSGTGFDPEPSLVWNGSEYAAAWSGYPETGTNEIYFARFDALGRKLGSDVRITFSPEVSSSAPSLVWNGTGYGLAWVQGQSSTAHTYFVRLDLQGNKIGTELQVSEYEPYYGDCGSPSLVWTDGGYGLAWHRVLGQGLHEIHFARLDAAGNKIGGVVHVAGSSSQDPALVWTGSELGLSWWNENTTPQEVMFVRLTPYGVKLGTEVNLADPESEVSSSRPSIVWTGSEYAVSFHAYWDGAWEPQIRLARLDSQGHRLGSSTPLTDSCDGAVDPSLAWTGSEFGVAWWDYCGSTDAVSFSRADAAGIKLGSDVRIADIDNVSGPSTSLAWNGSEYGVAWDTLPPDSFYTVYFNRIGCCDDADGDGYTECYPDPNDADPTSYPGGPDSCDGRDNNGNGFIDDGCDATCDDPEPWGLEQRVTTAVLGSSDASLVHARHGYGVAWKDGRTGSDRIYFATLDESGNQTGTDRPITFGQGAVGDPTLVWTGDEYGLAWEDSRSGNPEIYFARLDVEGTKIGADVRVTVDPANSWDPSLIWSGSGYGLAWYDTRDGNAEIYFARLDIAGNKIGQDIAVTQDDNKSSYSPSLASTGSGFTVAWHDYRNNHYDIYVAMLDTLGNKIGSDIRITNDSGGSFSATLVPQGIQFGLAWYDDRDGNFEIYFVRLNSAGNKIGSEVRVTDAVGASYLPSLTANGTEYGLSWYDQRWGNWDIFFARIDADGNQIGYDLRVTTDPGSSWLPSLVWSGNEYAAAWHDTRDGDTEIYFGRVSCCDDADVDGFTECYGDPNDADPTIDPYAMETCDGRDNDGNGSLDTGCDGACDNPASWQEDTQVSDAGGGTPPPSLAWTGSGYGVAWADARHGETEVYFARVDSLGAKFGSDVRITDYAGSSDLPSLAWTGSGYGVAWRDGRYGSGEIFFARLDAAGSKVGSDIRVTHDLAESSSPSLVWSGNEYGVAWRDERDGDKEIYFARLDATGHRIGADVRVTEDGAWSQAPSLLWTGSGYGIAWEDTRDGNYEIYFARIDASGAKLGTDVRVSNDGAASWNPSAVWAGGEYGIAWQDSRQGPIEIYFARIDASGSPFGPEMRVTTFPGSSEEPSLAWSGGEYGVAWRGYETATGNWGIYFNRFDASGAAIGDETKLSGNPNGAFWPSLVWNGTEYGVAWGDNRPAAPGIYLARVRCCDDRDDDGYTECANDPNDADPSTYPLAPELCDDRDNDGDGVIDEGCDGVCDNPEKIDSDLRMTADPAISSRPSLVWAGDQYGIAWHDSRDGNEEIYFGRISSTGDKLGSDLRLTSDPASSAWVALVWTGAVFGVTWRDLRDESQEIYFTRLDASGSTLGVEKAVSDDSLLATRPSLVWTGSEYGVAWGDERDGNKEIYLARLDDTGTRIGADLRVTSDPSSSELPSLIWNGQGYGLAWRDYRDGNWEVYFVRLNAVGERIGSEIRVTSAAGNAAYPSLQWTGSEYAVAWQDNRDGDWEIYFARLDSAGGKIGSDLRITDAAGYSFAPVLVWTGEEYAVSWYDGRDGIGDVYFVQLDPEGNKKTEDGNATENPAASWYPSLVWTGERYGLAWQDQRDGNDEIYFLHARCCDDADSDTFTECEDDCDDDDDEVYPDADEICDYKDNNCNGSIDEGYATPGVTTGLVFWSDGQTLSWDSQVLADSYDVIKGDLVALRTGAGDFSSSVTECFDDGGTDTQAADSDDPDAGQALFYLVRAQAVCRHGTYDTTGPAQQEERDTEVEASGTACP